MYRDDRTPGSEPFRDAERTCVLYHLHRAMRVADRVYDAAYRPFGLSTTQVFLLVAIRNLQPVPLRRLARAALLDPTTLSRNLGLLTRARWVKVSPGKDRRVRVAGLTPAGLAQVRRVYPAWAASQALAADRLGKKELKRLIEGLATLVDRLLDAPEAAIATAILRRPAS